MIYERALRSLLFQLDPETAHHFALASLRAAGGWWSRQKQDLAPVDLFGLHFRHRVGLAAGFDKNGVALAAWEALGFAFVEIGTVTARAQPGNPRPRIFRYPAQEALVNRLGFNNDGAAVIAERLATLRRKRRWPKIPVGINIGKSRITPLENATDDYLHSFRLLRDHADYVVLNVSSPNTPGLRELQHATQLRSLLRAIGREGGSKPLLVKIAPDLEVEELRDLIEVCAEQNVSGIIATNTTVDHSAIPGERDETGGVSGKPVREKSTAIIRQLRAQTKMPIIGCGGIFDQVSAREKIEAGAQLLQIYTGLIYRGPGLIRELARL